MAVIELIFPKFKPDQGIIDEMERDWPIIFKKLTNPNPGILSTFRGWILTENGRNVREENRAFLLFEWNKVESFHSFVASDQFAGFVALIRHLVTGPSTLQLCEVNLSPKDAASASSIEIIRVTVPSAENAQAALEVWDKISLEAKARFGDKVAVTYGKSQNLDEEVIAGIIGWSRPEDCVQATEGGVLADSFQSLKALGDLSHITVELGTMEVPPM